MITESITEADYQMHKAFMQEALLEAKKAGALGEVPIGAVIVYKGEIIARGHNRSIIDHDPTAHAEIVAIRKACAKLKNYRLPGSTLYVTLEPCTMCAGSFLHTRIDTVVYGAGDSRNGALGTNLNINDYKAFNHKITIIPRILQEECSSLIKAFFRERRVKK
ncbi:tRNA adenosine(34) deaminase TadA [Ignatzschineria cameli]|uniref:tRNA-specific adenosine deaminase n=1 Tax=Ignatzschineria cameli TaxID=2182793 RepID=A0A2U2AS17_9GAMM|nr:tRNA adenosine(34) deaminase TadA [Ignatzschineria cameli]PWD87034.1 tRNA adenosine(34) deaminase TadA [Ignatzschineria cameli]PWD92007.1 tRNA adenosine(34) deaminase TadA [Ignatzschineria cameli]PWD93645.1 tRNA adenosine(34) deaminase TadA [Ignatzschineria cameli]PWD94387.1 tRNA adenosine(34) deaminase TadA [Ignatzschineria cameli]